jgi:FdhD protein
MMKPAQLVDCQIWRHNDLRFGGRSILEDTAVALTYNDGTHAVMMTTPQDLEDFAVGFSLNDDIISSTVELDSLEVLRLCDGIERRMWLSGPKADRQQRAKAAYCGPTGCGLCGIQSVAEASRPAAIVGPAGITLAAIARVGGFEVFTHPYRILFGAIADAPGR